MSALPWQKVPLDMGSAIEHDVPCTEQSEAHVYRGGTVTKQVSADFRGLGWDGARRLVRSAVREVTKGAASLPAPHSFEDLSQEGMAALWQASRDFDPGREVPFAQFARQSVAYALLRYLRMSDPLPERSRRDLRKIQRAEDDLAAAGEQSPSVHQLALATGLTPQRVLRVRREQYEATAPQDSGMSYAMDYPGLSGDTPEDRYLLWESRSRIRQAFLGLTTRQRSVFQLHFLEHKTVTETAALLGISKGRVSQLSHEVERILREAIDG